MSAAAQYGTETSQCESFRGGGRQDDWCILGALGDGRFAVSSATVTVTAGAVAECGNYDATMTSQECGNSGKRTSASRKRPCHSQVPESQSELPAIPHQYSILRR